MLSWHGSKVNRENWQRTETLHFLAGLFLLLIVLRESSLRIWRGHLEKTSCSLWRTKHHPLSWYLCFSSSLIMLSHVFRTLFALGKRLVTFSPVLWPVYLRQCHWDLLCDCLPVFSVVSAVDLRWIYFGIKHWFCLHCWHKPIQANGKPLSLMWAQDDFII